MEIKFHLQAYAFVQGSNYTINNKILMKSARGDKVKSATVKSEARPKHNDERFLDQSIEIGIIGTAKLKTLKGQQSPISNQQGIQGIIQKDSTQSKGLGALSINSQIGSIGVGSHGRQTLLKTNLRELRENFNIRTILQGINKRLVPGMTIIAQDSNQPNKISRNMLSQPNGQSSITKTQEGTRRNSQSPTPSYQLASSHQSQNSPHTAFKLHKLHLNTPQEKLNSHSQNISDSRNIIRLSQTIMPQSHQNNAASDPEGCNFSRTALMSPIHAGRLESKRAVRESLSLYQRNEQRLKHFRLGIENKKIEVIEKFDHFNIKSPREWRDNLINFRIRRKILNRESSLTLQQKEELYNGSNLTQEDLGSLERTVLKVATKGQDTSKVEEESAKCLPDQTIRVLVSQNQRFRSKLEPCQWSFENQSSEQASNADKPLNYISSFEKNISSSLGRPLTQQVSRLNQVCVKNSSQLLLGSKCDSQKQPYEHSRNIQSQQQPMGGTLNVHHYSRIRKTNNNSSLNPYNINFLKVAQNNGENNSIVNINMVLNSMQMSKKYSIVATAGQPQNGLRNKTAQAQQRRRLLALNEADDL